MSEFEIHVEGLEEVKRKLAKIEPRLAERIERGVLRQGANYMARVLRRNVPVKTGRMKKAIRVKASRFNRLRKNGVVGVYLTISKGKSRTDPKGAYYAPWVENGYNRGSKLVTGRQAVAAGLVSRQQYQAKRAFVNAKRRPGMARQGIRYRSGGDRIEGQHFIRKTFNATKDTAARLIADASKVAVERIIRAL